MKNYFESIGFTVDKNNPFSGSIVPTKFYRKDKRVKSIMIEINKKIYMKNNIINEIEVNKLKKIITVLLKEKISKF
jgi:N-formylglutamate amidohydrolase